MRGHSFIEIYGGTAPTFDDLAESFKKGAVIKARTVADVF